MNLNKKFLETYDEEFDEYESRGSYNTMQFVLRLRRDIHQKILTLPKGIIGTDKIDFEGIQAHSTYLHETVHWWQHVGSISGLILSFTNPMQTHINKKELDDFLNISGPKKSIYKLYLNLNGEDKNDVQKNINTIIHNFYDIEFFKFLTMSPSQANKIVNNQLFLSVGHTFHITYSAFNNLLGSCFDKEHKFLPKIEKWDIEFTKLNNNKIQGFYLGSPVVIAPIGIKAIYEGQARFIQLQYLYFSTGKNFTLKDFSNDGLLNGIYVEAFNHFLQLTDSTEPHNINDPLIALFLLICDISINPTDGFPFDITDYENFINLTDPGIRFISLCSIIKEQYPEMKLE